MSAKKAKSRQTAVSGCEFNVLKFDAKAVDAIQVIATGLVETAKALGVLASVLKGSGVELECMLKIEQANQEPISILGNVVKR